jgi:hypothetical protein
VYDQGRDLRGQPAIGDSWDCSLALLRSFPNVLISQRTASFTEEALSALSARLERYTRTLLSEGREDASIITDVTGDSDDETPSDVSVSSERAYGEAGEAASRLLARMTPADDKALQAAAAASSAAISSSTRDLEEPSQKSQPPRQEKIAIFSTSGYVRAQLADLVRAFPKSVWLETACEPSTAAMCEGAGICVCVVYVGRGGCWGVCVCDRSVRVQMLSVSSSTTMPALPL